MLQRHWVSVQQVAKNAVPLPTVPPDRHEEDVVDLGLQERVFDIPRRSEERQDEDEKFGLSSQLEFLGGCPRDQE